MADVALETSCTMTGMLVFTVTVPAGQNCPATATRPTDIPVSMFYQKLIWLAKERLCDTTNANCIRAISAGFMDSAAVVPTSANLMERVRVKMAQAALKVMDTHAVDGGAASFALSDVAGATVDDVLRSYTATAARSASDRASSYLYLPPMFVADSFFLCFSLVFCFPILAYNNYRRTCRSSACGAALPPSLAVRGLSCSNTKEETHKHENTRSLSFCLCCVCACAYMCAGE
ncbi:putative integral membrane protein [Leishmania donovani]|uniref:Putative integral membrane protein n=1 Tax=Leishmania donovani TaxID=5661 RepID=A0A504XTV4_LEIDO|nr:putative integral membrane protein [Leishmania donovani]